MLERLAQQHDIAAREVSKAMTGCAEDLLSDLTFEVERELIREIEVRDGV